VAPVISTQPAAVSVAAGGAATLSVVANGIPAPTFQWSIVGGTSLADGVGTGQLAGANITGASSSTLTLTNLPQSANGLQFVARVSNSAGSADSTATPLSVTAVGVGTSIGAVAGGTVTSSDGRVQITIPPGALTADSVVTVLPTTDISLPASLSLDAVVVGNTSYRISFVGGTPVASSGITTAYLPPAVGVATRAMAAARTVLMLAATTPSSATQGVQVCGGTTTAEAIVHPVDPVGGGGLAGLANPILTPWGCDPENSANTEIAQANQVLTPPAALAWGQALVSTGGLSLSVAAYDMDGVGRVAVLYRLGTESTGVWRVRLLRADGSQYADVALPTSVCPVGGGCTASHVRLDAAGVAVAGSNTTTRSMWVARVGIRQSSLLGALPQTQWQRSFAPTHASQQAKATALALAANGDVFVGGFAAGTVAQPQTDLNMVGPFVARLGAAAGSKVWATSTTAESTGWVAGNGIPGAQVTPIALGVTSADELIMVGSGQVFIVNGFTPPDFQNVLGRFDALGNLVQRSDSIGTFGRNNIGLEVVGTAFTVAGGSDQSGSISLVRGFAGGTQTFAATLPLDDPYGTINGVGTVGGNTVVYTTNDRVLRFTGNQMDITGGFVANPGCCSYSSLVSGPSRLADIAGNVLLVGRSNGVRAGVSNMPPGAWADFVQKVRLP
jgi:hypothetical protein